MGHGIASTLLQLSKGYSIISNGGYDINPTLINKANYKNVTTSNDFKSRWKEPETFMVYTTLIDNDWKADDVNNKYTWVM